MIFFSKKKKAPAPPPPKKKQPAPKKKEEKVPDEPVHVPPSPSIKITYEEGRHLTAEGYRRRMLKRKK